MTLTIAHDEVHLWTARLDRDADEVDRLANTLSADEAARAARFLRPSDRDRFTVARGTLRSLLGAYLGLQPEAVSFVYGPQGKPALAPPLDPALAFNVAHAGDLALYGVARGRRIGVDVERLRDDFDYEDIVRRFFTPEEAAALQSVPGAQRVRAFYTLWTGKEAYAKAWGEGLAQTLKEVVVAIDAEREPRLLPASGSIHNPQGWMLRIVDPAPGYLGAIVGEGDDWTVTWQP